MPFDIRTPLLNLAREIARKAVRGMNDGSLDASEANELNRCAGAFTKVAELATTYRLGDCGRDAHYWAPPAQNRTCGIPASGSHLGCLTAQCPYTGPVQGTSLPGSDS